MAERGKEAGESGRFRPNSSLYYQRLKFTNSAKTFENLILVTAVRTDRPCRVVSCPSEKTEWFRYCWGGGSVSGYRSSPSRFGVSSAAAFLMGLNFR